MTEQKEKIGVLKRVAPSKGGLIFEDEPDVWYNATKTAAQYVKADLKGKKVTIRLADKPHTFSFISLSSGQPEKAPVEQGVKEETKAPMTKDNYWERKEARDLISDERISRHGALNTALNAIKAGITSGSSGATMKPESILDMAEQLANSKVLPFVKGIAKNK
ncbi:MAG: hypothetical protein V3V78_00430 [Candidatus Woesearchaeota archaeon]